MILPEATQPWDYALAQAAINCDAARKPLEIVLTLKELRNFHDCQYHPSPKIPKINNLEKLLKTRGDFQFEEENSKYQIEIKNNFYVIIKETPPKEYTLSKKGMPIENVQIIILKDFASPENEISQKDIMIIIDNLGVEKAYTRNKQGNIIESAWRGNLRGEIMCNEKEIQKIYNSIFSELLKHLN